MGCAPCEARQARLLAFANSHAGLLALALFGAALIAFAPSILTRNHQESNP